MTTIVVFAAVVVAIQHPPAAPPSQVELNGFLLGQHVGTVSATFGEPAVVQESPDGWVDRVYYTDSTQSAYMVFGFTPDRPDYVAAIQLTGRRSADQLPFLGLFLGDSMQAVEDRLGPATDRVVLPDWPADRLEYDGRNYSVEVDSGGVLLSIRIQGYAGLPEQPDSGAGPLATLHDALDSRNADVVLDAMMPDFEIFRDGEVLRFTGPGRREMRDTASAVWHGLVVGERSLRAILDGTALDSVHTDVRIHEQGPVGIVARFAGTSPLQEIVFVVYAGRWRVWEVRYR